MTFLSDFIFACLEDLESLKVSNTIPQKIASSSPMARPRIGTPSSGCSGSVASCRWTMRSTFAGFGGLGRPESRQQQASEDRFVFPLVTVHKTMSTSCRRSSMRKWRNCTFLHSVRSSPSLLEDKNFRPTRTRSATCRRRSMRM